MDATDQFSLRGKVFHTIRENILSGRYKYQEELRESTLGKELGVSRTPVREALRQLELEGLVTIVPNKGAYVNGITAQDVEVIYQMRSRLEGLCARMACERITREQLDEMEEVILLSKFHEKKGNYDQLVELDSRSMRSSLRAARANFWSMSLRTCTSMSSVCGRLPWRAASGRKNPPRSMKILCWPSGTRIRTGRMSWLPDM